MNIISRTILAFALAAGIAPAFAQAPSPVPALPDTERRTSYTISNTTCACAVGFALYGDSTDYGNWVEVWLNGALVSSANYTITSPSGPLATLPRPITDAVLTFTSVQTGTVQIVGARRPRRTSQFTENRGVAARDLNQALTDIVAQNRETWDRTNDVAGRTVRVPPGETMATLPPLAGRANLGAVFDAGGNLVPGASVPSTTFTAGNGIAFSGTGPTTITNNIAAGGGISITGTNPLTIAATAGASALYVRPQDFGAACDGSTDDKVALQAMFTASAGKTIFIPAGSTCVTSAPLNLPSNTTLVGANTQSPSIKGIGSAWPILLISNKTSISITGVWFQGSDNVTSWTSSTVGAIQFGQNGSAPQIGSNIFLRNNKFSGFNNNYWVNFNTQGSTLPASNIIIDGNQFITATADIPTDPVPSNNSNSLIIFFSGTAGGGRYENVRISNNFMQADAACFGIILFGDTYKYQLIGNHILRPGQTNSSHCTNGFGATNAYGITVYDLNSDGNPSADGIVSNNYINSPVGSGIYFAGNGASTLRSANSARTTIENNLIVGQSSLDSLLPRGAISINDTTDISIVGNSMYSNGTCINVAAQNAGDVSILSNNCTSDAGGSNGFQLTAGTNGSSNTDNRVIRGNHVNVMGTALTMASTVGGQFANVDIAGNTLFGVGGSINAGGNYFAGALTVGSNRLSGTANFSSITGGLGLLLNSGLSFTASTLLGIAAGNGSQVFVSDGTPGSACTGGSTGSMAFRQNNAWKCF